MTTFENELASSVRSIAVADITPAPGNRAWGGFDAAAQSDLVASMAAVGLVHPVVLRVRDGAAKITYKLVAGERRVRAAQTLGWERIPAFVLPADTRNDAALGLALAENLHRLSLHPLDEMAGYATLQELGVEPAGIARWCGRSAEHVHGRLRLLSLTDENRRHWQAGRLGVGTASVLARLPRDHQQRVAGKIASAKTDPHDGTQIPAWKLASWIEEETDLLEAAPFDIADAALVPEAGPCTECPKRGGFQGTLFADERPAGERCFDRPCWRGKVQAHVERRRADLKEQHGDDGFFAASTSATPEAEGTLGAWEYQRRDDGKPILLVDGPKAGEVITGLPKEEALDASNARNDAEHAQYRAARKARNETFEAIARDLLKLSLRKLTDVLTDAVPCLLPRIAANREMLAPMYVDAGDWDEIDWKEQRKIGERVERQAVDLAKWGTKEALQQLLLFVLASTAGSDLEGWKAGKETHPLRAVDRLLKLHR